ncbi:MAG: hypothetical protein EXR99_02655 [Gemmataceae bacterium]|nr:hypothetical protein [Gemmataceae bacterium]
MKIFVVVAKGASVDFLSLYGHEGAQQPNLENLASQGLVLDRYFASTLSDASIRQAWKTGNFPFTPLQEGGFSLFQELRRLGWNSHFFSDSTLAEPERFFLRDFDQIHSQGDISLSLDGLLQQVSQSKAFCSPGENSLLWLEISTLLPPWNVGEPHWPAITEDFASFFSRCEFAQEDEEISPESHPQEGEPVEKDSRFLAIQAGCLAAWAEVDRFVGNLVVGIQKEYGDEDWGLVFLGDRPVSPGSHGLFGRNPKWLHREFVQLPFLCYFPSQGWQGQRRLGFFQDIDLAPTLLEMARLPVPMLQGKSVFSTRGFLAGARPYALTRYAAQGEKFQVAFRTGEGAYLVQSGQEAEEKFFVYPDDRLEMNNLVQTEMALVENHRNQLRGVESIFGLSVQAVKVE